MEEKKSTEIGHSLYVPDIRSEELEGGEKRMEEGGWRRVTWNNSRMILSSSDICVPSLNIFDLGYVLRMSSPE